MCQTVSRWRKGVDIANASKHDFLFQQGGAACHKAEVDAAGLAPQDSLHNNVRSDNRDAATLKRSRAVSPNGRPSSNSRARRLERRRSERLQAPATAMQSAPSAAAQDAIRRRGERFATAVALPKGAVPEFRRAGAAGGSGTDRAAAAADPAAGALPKGAIPEFQRRGAAGGSSTDQAAAAVDSSHDGAPAASTAPDALASQKLGALMLKGIFVHR